MNFKNKLVQDLKSIVGDKYILTAKWNKQQFSKGWRYGEGEALAVVKSGTLLEIWKILKICVKADVIVIMQGANTGLTGEKMKILITYILYSNNIKQQLYEKIKTEYNNYYNNYFELKKSTIVNDIIDNYNFNI